MPPRPRMHTMRYGPMLAAGVAVELISVLALGVRLGGGAGTQEAAAVDAVAADQPLQQLARDARQGGGLDDAALGSLEGLFQIGALEALGGLGTGLLQLGE